MHGLTQAELGHLIGVGQQMVSQWERGRSQPNPAHRRVIEGILGSDWSGEEHASRHLRSVTVSDPGASYRTSDPVSPEDRLRQALAARIARGPIAPPEIDFLVKVARTLFGVEL